MTITRGNTVIVLTDDELAMASEEWRVKQASYTVLEYLDETYPEETCRRLGISRKELLSLVPAISSSFVGYCDETADWEYGLETSVLDTLADWRDSHQKTQEGVIQDEL